MYLPVKLLVSRVSTKIDQHSRVTVFVCNQPPRTTQPPILSGVGNEYRSKCRDALRLRSTGRCGSLHLWIKHIRL